MKPNPLLPDRRQQRGVVAIIFGLMLVVLIAFAGLVVDVGRFFVIKSELQNAVDACALAAASQLRPGMNDTEVLNRAVAYGTVFSTGGVSSNPAIQNRANFQSAAVNIGARHISFATTLGGPYASDISAASNAHYVKCDVPLTDLPIYFLRILNIFGLGPLGPQTVSAMAVATQGSQTCNLVPAGVCARSTEPVHHGLLPGEWLTLGDKLAPGVFGWMDYSPVAGGTPEVKDGLTAVGQCELPAVGTDARENGKKTSAQDAWNTRFGIYSNPYRIGDIAIIPPDKTGYAYFNNKDSKTGNYYPWANWLRDDSASGPSAFDGSYAGSLNYESAGNTMLAFQSDARTILSGPATFATGGPKNQHDLEGRSSRRLVVVPIVDCDSKPLIIQGLACALMLNPFGRVGGDPINGKLEYIGPASAFPCGNTTVTGPRMSVLVK